MPILSVGGGRTTDCGGDGPETVPVLGDREAGLVDIMLAHAGRSTAGNRKLARGQNAESGLNKEQFSDRKVLPDSVNQRSPANDIIGRKDVYVADGWGSSLFSGAHHRRFAKNNGATGRSKPAPLNTTRVRHPGAAGPKDPRARPAHGHPKRTRERPKPKRDPRPHPLQTANAQRVGHPRVKIRTLEQHEGTAPGWSYRHASTRNPRATLCKLQMRKG